MRKAMGLGFLGAILLLGASVLASGNGDVVIRLNGGDNVAYIGEANTLEFWIRNPEPLYGMKIGFLFGVPVEFHWSADLDPGGNHYLIVEPSAVGAFDEYEHKCHEYDQESANEFRNATFYFGAADDPLPVHQVLTHCYTYVINIAPGQEEVPYGLTVENIASPWCAYDNPNNWSFTSASGVYPPDFGGHTNTSISIADAPTHRFHIVNRNRGDCCAGTVGDVNGSGGDPTIGDVVALIDHLFVSNCGLFCTAEADINQSGGEYAVSGPGGDISIGDVSLLIDHLFVNGTPLPTCN